MREDVTFESGDGTCAAWLYPPADDRRAIVVMAHGLGAVREMRLDAYAERFAAAGLGALVFDYRHFGASSGEPRQLLDIGRQLEDWASAVRYARGLADQVALFGTSFSGGHVLVTAARVPGIAAAIAQCPFTSGSASARTLGIRGTLGVTAAALRDLAAVALRRPPVQVALAGPPGSAALMNAPDALAGYTHLMPMPDTTPNHVAARVALAIPLHHPGRMARRIPCPVLFCVCERDSVAPPGPTLRYAAHAPQGEVVSYPVGHFDVYVGEPFERATSDQLDFLDRHLDKLDRQREAGHTEVTEGT